MKKILSMLLVFSLLLGCSTTMAEDLGVQVIGNGDVAYEAMSLDDLQCGVSYSIDGYARITPVSFEIVDCFAQFKGGEAGNLGQNTWANTSGSPSEFVRAKDKSAFWYMKWMESGTNADFCMLLINITNLTKNSINYADISSVKVIYDEDYEFEGWIRQYNSDYHADVYRYDGPQYSSSWNTWPTPYLKVPVIAPTDVETIGMMYTGSYFFGCTLPDEVYKDDKPLRMEINLGENQLTYNIRK